MIKFLILQLVVLLPKLLFNAFQDTLIQAKCCSKKCYIQVDNPHARQNK